jgi:murein DD-endopeptidase MepM/ murein hydrolase activator NlpD
VSSILNGDSLSSSVNRFVNRLPTPVSTRLRVEPIYYDGNMRTVLGVLVVALIAAGSAYWIAGHAAGPIIVIAQPARAVGADSPLEVTVESPGGAFSRIDIEIAQGATRISLFSLASPTQATVGQVTADRIRITRSIGKRSIPALQAGTAEIVVTAARSVLFGLRTRESRAARLLQVVLAPPRLAVVSTHHFVNHGGAEFVVYRATPAEAVSGVRVGGLLYPGFPAADAGVAGADPALKVAFFALLYDQDLTAPVELYAKDEAGNEATSRFDYKALPKRFQRSRIDLSDAFLQKVVSEILGATPDFKAAVGPDGDLLGSFLRINRELREKNGALIASLSSRSSPKILWKGAFVQLGNSKVESKFADYRTYFYQGREVDRQVHLGFDLAVTANVPVRAGNDGTVLYADYLGIYGNCVVIDHGLGVQSLYGHLSSLAVKTGDTVEKGQVIGKSGTTGLAGGDHLHFAMLVGGRPVSPVEWWDPHWIEDRVMRKLREAR